MGKFVETVWRWTMYMVLMVWMAIAMVACNMDIHVRADGSIDQNGAEPSARFDGGEVRTSAPGGEALPDSHPDSCIGERCNEVGPVLQRVGFFVQGQEVLGLGVILDEHRVVAIVPNDVQQHFGSIDLSFRPFRSRRSIRVQACATGREVPPVSIGVMDFDRWFVCSTDERLLLPTDGLVERFLGNTNGMRQALSVGWRRTPDGLDLITKPCRAEAYLTVGDRRVPDATRPSYAVLNVSGDCLGPLIFEAPFSDSWSRSSLFLGLSNSGELLSDAGPPLTRSGVSAFSFQDVPVTVEKIATDPAYSDSYSNSIVVLDRYGSVFVRHGSGESPRLYGNWQFWEKVETPNGIFPGGGIRSIEVVDRGEFLLLTNRALTPPSTCNALRLVFSSNNATSWRSLCGENDREQNRYFHSAHGVILDVTTSTLRIPANSTHRHPIFLYADGYIVDTLGGDIAPSIGFPALDAIACDYACRNILVHTTADTLLIYSRHSNAGGGWEYALDASTVGSAQIFLAHFSSLMTRNGGQMGGWVVSTYDGSFSYFHLPTRDPSVGPQLSIVESLVSLRNWSGVSGEVVAANDFIFAVRSRLIGGGVWTYTDLPMYDIITAF
jgi:hypothetical protein